MPTTETFKKKQTFDKYESMCGKGYDAKPLEINVFGCNHKKVADDLHTALLKSGFLEQHPLFSIRVETMDGYKFPKS
jgi:hypothetical protein